MATGSARNGEAGPVEMPAERRLDVALVALHPELSRRRARAAIEKGQVTVNGETVLEAGRAVGANDHVTWHPHRPAQRRARLALPRLIEDEHLIVIDKPAGLLSVPTAEADPTREPSALGHVRDYVTHLRPRAPFVGRVHRLDRDTSGALMFALSPPARARLIEMIAAHRVERTYLAIVVGIPRAAQGTIDAPIRDAYKGGRRGVAHADEPSSPARTHFKVRERWEGAALLEVRLETGRQHQIRAHLSHVGLPVLGDTVYGRGVRWPIDVPRLMLHAWKLALAHPVTGAALEVEAPWPEDLRAAIDRLHRRNTDRSQHVRRGNDPARARTPRGPRRS